LKTAYVIIVTGLSGSGKSTAIKALEDLGFFCIDNLPLLVLDKVLTLAEQHDEILRVALGIDVRERAFLVSFPETLARIRTLGHEVDVLFLDASDDVLVRRYSETRRRHPLEGEAATVGEAIDLERRMLAELREKATWVLDTSTMNVHRLKQAVQQGYDPARGHSMSITLMSFGFKHGSPREADYMFDCRLLSNPFFIQELRPMTGLDADVLAFLEARPEWPPFLDHVTELLRFALPLHETEGKPVLTAAFGCTGGQHRSVAVTEAIAARLRDAGREVRTIHRDLDDRHDDPRT
jgi:UPF0042 nucleotide-binding protein